MGPLDVSVPTHAPTKCTKEDLQKITKLRMDLFLQGQGSCLEPIGHRDDPQEV